MLIGIVLLLFWQMIVFAQTEIFPVNHIGTRILWYLYYIPTVFIPNCMVLMALYYNRHPDQRIPNPWYLTLILSGLCAAAVLTNDFHQQAFRFPEGIDNFDKTYTYGPAYFITMTWMFTMFVMSAIILFRRASEKIQGRNVWTVFIGLFLAVLYFLWYVLGKPFMPWFTDMFDFPQVFTGIIIVSMALCVILGLLRANFNFVEFFEASDTGAILVDFDGKLRYSTHDAIETTMDQMRQALKEPLYVDENHRLEGERIGSGYTFWSNDLSTVNRLAEKLAETQALLKEENDIISAENEMLARRAKADEQNNLYNLMATSVRDEIQKVKEILDSTGPDSPDFKDKLAQTCIYKTYIKRYSNLLLLKQDNVTLNSFELYSSIRESLDYVRLIHPNFGFDGQGEGEFRAEDILGLFRAYQDIITKYLFSDNGGSNGRDGLLLVQQIVSGGVLKLNIKAGSEELFSESVSVRAGDEELFGEPIGPAEEGGVNG